MDNESRIDTNAAAQEMAGDLTVFHTLARLQRKKANVQEQHKGPLIVSPDEYRQVLKMAESVYVALEDGGTVHHQMLRDSIINSVAVPEGLEVPIQPSRESNPIQ